MVHVTGFINRPDIKLRNFTQRLVVKKRLYRCPLTGLLNQTYKKSAAAEMSGFNKAFFENKKAITGIFPATAIDFPNVLLSSGSLHNADAPKVASDALKCYDFAHLPHLMNNFDPCKRLY